VEATIEAQFDQSQSMLLEASTLLEQAADEYVAIREAIELDEDASTSEVVGVLANVVADLERAERAIGLLWDIAEAQAAELIALRRIVVAQHRMLFGHPPGAPLDWPGVST